MNGDCDQRQLLLIKIVQVIHCVPFCGKLANFIHDINRGLQYDKEPVSSPKLSQSENNLYIDELNQFDATDWVTFLEEHEVGGSVKPSYACDNNSYACDNNSFKYDLVRPGDHDSTFKYVPTQLANELMWNKEEDKVPLSVEEESIVFECTEETSPYLPQAMVVGLLPKRPSRDVGLPDKDTPGHRQRKVEQKIPPADHNENEEEITDKPSTELLAQCTPLLKDINGRLINMSQSKSVGTVLPEEKPPFAQQPAFNKTPEPKRKPADHGLDVKEQNSIARPKLKPPDWQGKE